MKTVVIGFLGSSLDRRGKAGRWEIWRPSVGVCQHEDLLVHRFHLLHNQRDASLAEGVRADIGLVSPETEVVLERLDFNNPWDFEEVFARLLDYSQSFTFDREHEEYLLHITTGTHVAQICLFLLTEAGFFPGKLLQTGPGRHNTPPGSYALIDLDLSRYDSIARRFAQKAADDLSFLKSGIPTRNRAFNAMMTEVEKVTLRSDAPILLTGPTGAGKSRLARRIYELKRQNGRITGRFVEVNCATLRGDMALSVLFGHRRGAFTGATSDRAGLLVSADKGLLFLDEIGELGLDEQAMLLQAIEEKRLMPVGSDTEVASDFSLICGTNRDLNEAVRRGRFRDDLLARIGFWNFRLPALAERSEDIEPNLDFELQCRSREIGKPVTFSAEARRAFLRFATGPDGRWPANFRDLNRSIARMAVLSEGNRIGAADVTAEQRRLRDDWRTASAEPGHQVLIDLLGDEAVATIDLFDRCQLAEVVRICQRCRTMAEAGRLLFAQSRQARTRTNDTDRLRKYLQRFGISWAMIVDASQQHRGGAADARAPG